MGLSKGVSSPVKIGSVGEGHDEYMVYEVTAADAAHIKLNSKNKKVSL